MPTTFLFAETLDETGCVGLQLENNSAVQMPLMHRTFAEIKAMQLDSYTVLVLSTSLCGLYKVELPWLGYRKAHAAIPYALEEQLVQSLSALHFAFDRAHHLNNCYLVLVIAKTLLSEMMHCMQVNGITLNEITIDWFGLNTGEIVVSPSEVLSRTELFQGALKGELATNFLKTIADPTLVHAFETSKNEWKLPTFAVESDPYFLWIAKRLIHARRMNLCQGEFELSNDESKRNYPLLLICAASIGLWVVSIVLVNAVNVMRLNSNIAQVDNNIATIYHQFFPGVQQVVNPKFQIMQLLNTGRVEKTALLFWQLLDKFEQAMNQNNALTVVRMEYHASSLSVALLGPDFAALEQFEKKLKQANVKVVQTQATTHKQKVSATLELRL